MFPSHPRFTILESRFPLYNTISEGRPPQCNTSSEAGRQPFNVRIQNDSGRKFSKSKTFKVFSETTFSRQFMTPSSLWAENIFLVFRNSQVFYPSFEVPTSPRYTILESRFPLCNPISEGGLTQCNTSSEAGRQPFWELWLGQKFSSSTIS